MGCRRPRAGAGHCSRSGSVAPGRPGHLVPDDLQAWFGFDTLLTQDGIRRVKIDLTAMANARIIIGRQRLLQE